MRTFVVGDVHGHLDELRALLERLGEEAAPGDALVFVGDYIDRGPDSKGVVELVMAQADGGWDGPVTALRGNHEALLLDFLDPEPEHDPSIWLMNGGVETIDSYGGLSVEEDVAALIPPEHLEFFRSTYLWHEDENGLYVHAGFLPEIEPDEQGEETMLWVRDEFIQSDYAWRKVVVFGHTPQYERKLLDGLTGRGPRWRVLDRPEKIGIDTGAAYGGPLTAVALPEREFFSFP